MAQSAAAPTPLRVAWPWLVGVMLAAVLLSSFRIVDPDTFWHLKTGQVILETGKLVRTNLFSAVHRDYPWHNMEWLFDVVLASAYNVGGWEGVAALKIALVAMTAAILFATLLAAAAAPWLAASLSVYVLALMRYRLTERPHLFSFLFFAFTIWAVDRDCRRASRVLWTLPPLFALWSNIHPELVLSLGYLAARFAGEWIDARGGGRFQPEDLKRHLSLLVLCAAATLANPATYRVISTPLLLLQPSLQQINEFERTSLARHPLFWALVGATALLFAVHRESRRWSLLLPFAFLGAVGAGYTRATTAFAQAVAPSLVRGLAAWSDNLSAPALRLLQAAAAASMICLTLGSLSFDHRLNYRWGAGPIPGRVPEAAASFILANDLPANLYNHYNDGGYLIFRLFPRMGVFQDGRGAAPREFYEALGRQHSVGFARLFEEFHVNTALVKAKEYGGLFSAEQWGVVYWDEDYAVLLRRSPAAASLLERLEYLAFRPGTGLPADTAMLSRTVEEMRRNQRERSAPDWWTSIGIGVALARLRDLSGAEQEFARGTELAPMEPKAWAYLGWVRLKLGKTEEAAFALGRARTLDPTGSSINKIVGPPDR